MARALGSVAGDCRHRCVVGLCHEPLFTGCPSHARLLRLFVREPTVFAKLSRMLRLKLFIAFLLDRYFFSLYRLSYWRFKKRQDQPILELMSKVYTPGNILDIGANIGFYSDFFSALVRNGKVYCFEPDKDNFRKLRKSLTGNNLVLEQAAVSNANGELELFVSPHLNVDHRTYRPQKFCGSYPVRAVRIDDYVGDRPISLIKMDIQGFEFYALQGMEQTLQKNPDVKLFMELWPYGLEKSGSSAAAVFNLLRDWGFRISLIREGLDELSLEAVESLSKDEFSYYNILACKSTPGTEAHGLRQPDPATSRL